MRFCARRVLQREPTRRTLRRQQSTDPLGARGSFARAIDYAPGAAGLHCRTAHHEVGEDLFELRTILESAAARLAAGRIDMAKLKSFNPRLAKYEVNDRKRKVDWIMANQEFHLEIARATGNEWLYQAILNGLGLVLNRDSI
jgi:DNA-binding FadR family transcriptional regulator